MRILAIDPGNVQSGYAVIDENYTPLAFGKLENHDLLDRLPVLRFGAVAVIEQIGHYGTGMPAGRSVFDTCVWIGRFTQALYPEPVALTLRATVKAHLCGSSKAKDGNVSQALVDRFAPGQPNHGKGTKAQPGFFHGFHADIWQAFALAVQHADTLTVDSSVTGPIDRRFAGDMAG